MNNNPLVSVIIPTRNSAIFLNKCLTSIKDQTYKNVEIIVVDNDSKDGTKKIAQKYTNSFFDIKSSNQFRGKFSATAQRNFGVKKAVGDIVYYFDADMEMTPNVLKDCVNKILGGMDAVIIPEDSFGSTFWAECKKLERRCYWKDNTIEAPRCFSKNVWDKLGGLDEQIAGGGDDWDLYQKTLEHGFVVGRIESIVLHNEGDLRLSKLVRKRFLYGKDSMKYLKKRKTTAFWQYFPIRKGFITHWYLFVRNPIIGIGTIYMRFVEYSAGAAGIIYSRLTK